MHSKTLLAILFAFVAACSACKPEDKPPPPTCQLGQPGAACTAPGDCCSNNCTNNVCIKDPCSATGTSCGGAGDCCTGACDGSCITPCAKKKLGEACTAGADCCSTACGTPNAICIKQPCAAQNASCTVGSDCCTGDCANGTSCDTGQCSTPMTACTAPSECCSNKCANSTCLIDNPKGPQQLCANNSECLSGYCTPTSPGYCDSVPPPPPVCKTSVDPCTTATAGDCCSKVCDKTGHCATDKKCKDAGKNCETNADCCSLHCSAPGVIGATCLGSQCSQVGQGCTGAADCCSGVCGAGNLCEPPPVGPSGATCKVTGEACATGVECCTTNCQGGRCWPASSCAPLGDVCWKRTDCCSGVCGDPQITGQAQRCVDAPGNCNQSGMPCAGASNCCTRRCEDIGWGVTVCKIPGGCVMTGDYCDSTFACCGGVNEANPLLANTYGVFCDFPNKNPGYPTFDTNNGGDYLCTRGQSCNPTGNICGLDASASQNCCDGKKAVCKFDDQNIPRCFGGCPNDICPVNCPNGYDGTPGCCKDTGAICQIREQCCNGLPCVPDKNDNNILKCTPSKTCLALGETCDPLAPNCCDLDDGVDPPLSCQNFEGAWMCAPPPPSGCTLGANAPCSPTGVAPDCCIAPNLCRGTPGAETCSPPQCQPKDATCTNSGDCCSPLTCDGELMICSSCQPLHGICTINADCCSGTQCVLGSGSTSGTCEPIPTGCRSYTGQGCSVKADCCTATDDCIGNVCTSTSCRQLSQACSMAANEACCAPEVCYHYDQFGTLDHDCLSTDPAGSCQCKNTCASTGNSCSVDTPCCPGTGASCLESGGAACSPASTSCTCRPPA